MSSSLARIVRNAWRIGPKEYMRQLNGMNDTKYGTLVGTDKYGNQFYENTEEDEIHLRTRWVRYRDYYGDMSQVEPGWHFWLGYGVDVPPNKTAAEFQPAKPVKDSLNYENLTGTPGAYMCYSTTKPKVATWAPKVAERG